AAVGTATVTLTFPFSWETVRSRNGTSLIGLGWNEPQPDISIATSSITRPKAPRRCGGQPPSLWDLVSIGMHPHRSAIGREWPRQGSWVVHHGASPPPICRCDEPGC